MTEPLAVLFVRALTLYLSCGVVVAAAVLLGHVVRLDPGLRDASYAVRALIAPGIVALWPMFVWRRLTERPTPVEHNAHRRPAAGSTDTPGATPRRSAEARR